jgi:hypothetical protein
MKFPKTLGACVDVLYKTREQRLKAQKEVDDTKAKEEALKQYILANLVKQDSNKFGGKLATATISRRTCAHVTDWDTFFPWVAETNSWDMVQKRVNDTAYRARLDENVEVPGVEPFEVVSINLTKQ